MKVKSEGRYQVPTDEDYQPNSNNTVLKNYLGITTTDEIERLEQQEFSKVLYELEDMISQDYQFTTEDLCAFHEGWLGDIYPMAGKFRTVAMSKGNFMFASPTQIPKLMRRFEQQYLAKFTPCNFDDVYKIAHALAIVHIEFILIHPFREGNGRLGRLLSSLMANQAGYPPLNFSPVDQINNPDGFDRYIYAIHQGLIGQYDPMIKLFQLIFDATLSLV